jgi:hypothetical protein
MSERHTADHPYEQPQHVVGYGAAVYDCEEDLDGRFWVGNGEYISQVLFCPFTGKPAPNQTVAAEGPRFPQ